jgi:hypothetical protein
MNWIGHVGFVGEMIYAYKVLVWKSERKIILTRSWSKKKDNIKRNLREMG